MLCMWQHGAWGSGAQLEANMSFHNVPCSADRALPSAQVQQARAEARAEAEAAAEQRLAALDQARREEREAVVRVALALGAGRVRAHPGTPLCVHFTTHTVTDMPPSRNRAHPHWALAQGPRFAVGGAAGRHALFSQVMCASAARSAPVCCCLPHCMLFPAC